MQILRNFIQIWVEWGYMGSGWIMRRKVGSDTVCYKELLGVDIHAPEFFLTVCIKNSWAWMSTD